MVHPPQQQQQLQTRSMSPLDSSSPQPQPSTSLARQSLGDNSTWKGRSGSRRRQGEEGAALGRRSAALHEIFGEGAGAATLFSAQVSLGCRICQAGVLFHSRSLSGQQTGGFRMFFVTEMEKVCTAACQAHPSTQAPQLRG